MNEKLELMSNKVQTSMHTNPMKWAGIAAGTGLGLGVLGRILKSRSKRRAAMMPDLLIIDCNC